MTDLLFASKTGFLVTGRALCDTGQYWETFKSVSSCWQCIMPSPKCDERVFGVTRQSHPVGSLAAVSSCEMLRFEGAFPDFPWLGTCRFLAGRALLLGSGRGE